MTIFQPNLTFWTDGNKGGPAQAGVGPYSPSATFVYLALAAD
jgi:hypothetical protein